jgi:hypothetical protein
MQETLQYVRPFLMIELSWVTRDPIERLLDEFDYVLLTYDAIRDKFRTNDESRQQNRFGVPRERLSSLPLMSGTEIFLANRLR